MNSISRFVSARSIGMLMVCAGCAMSAHADVTPSGAMMRFPAISKDKIAFVYANDIWIAPRDGGVATPLATPVGTEVFPKFSPDGSQIAFSANYDGVQSLYTLPVAGGAANRVTYFGSSPMPVSWTNQNELLFYAGNLQGLGRQSKLYRVSPEGGMPSVLPMPYGTFASMSPDGSQIAYIPHTTDFRTWKRYRGGMATDIWLFNLKDNSAKLITEWEGTDTFPMFNPAGKGDVVYYTSDEGPEHRLNVWSYDIASGKRTQITKFTDDDVRFPSIGPGPNGKGEIIFQLGSGLSVLDLGTGQTRKVTVTIPGDRQAVRTKNFDAAKNITDGVISPGAKRVAIIARGDIWTAPAKEGAPRNLTRTDSINEREVSWSPDGRWMAYISDESGEYEVWLRPSDAKAPEKKDDKKGDAKADEKKADEKKSEEPKAEQPAAEAKPDDAKKAEADRKSKPHRMTSLGEGQRMGLRWSPDSKFVTFWENTGKLYLLEVEPERLVVIDTDPWAGGPPTVSFSSDSKWIAYDRADDVNSNNCVWLYNIKTGEKTRVTSPMFASSDPAFDRKGDFLYFSSNRSINNPYYSDLDTTFIYTDTQLLHMLPLRKDVKSPYLPTSDEETYKEEAKKEEPKKDEGKKDEGKKDEGKKDAAPADDDGISGTWSGMAKGPDGSPVPPGGIPITLNIKLGSDGSVTGNLTGPMGNVAISSGRYDKATGELNLTISTGSGNGSIKGRVTGGKFEGTWSMGEISGEVSATRSGNGAAGKEAKSESKGEAKSADKSSEKEVKIDLENMEARAIRLPISPGRFRALAVSGDDKLIFVRSSSINPNERGGDIKIFDPKDDKKDEKLVTAGAGGYDLSADGKKLLVSRGPSLTIMDAAAGGGNSSSVPTSGMTVAVRPREQWKQILRDVYRYQRDYFYDQGLHGVDWQKVHDHYSKMVDDAVSREDVSYIIGEMISELNIGHAYVNPGAPTDMPMMSNVGLLGCDFVLDKTDKGAAYKIAKIYTGGVWDTDARGPLSQPGVDVKEGEYVLAVNGVPVDVTRDVWAAFQGLAERPTVLTIGKTPSSAADTRDVIVKPIGSDQGLRYRAWIEKNRAYVADKTKGRVGYIYVPNTGEDGQSDLFRQFVGQKGMDALIIDERWNGGGQIPTRFIELLNRKNTNYWARRNGHDWPWPPDANFGPKVMLANGLAGSGGDAFPGYFKRMGLGKVIGKRTWGGLVGIEGFRPLIDGGGVTVPSFGYYERDAANPASGRWSIEGHGTDPDIEVIDDPSKMVNGEGDPQLDVAIAELLKELETKAYVTPKRPPSPQRAGMGIPPNER